MRSRAERLERRVLMKNEYVKLQAISRSTLFFLLVAAFSSFGLFDLLISRNGDLDVPLSIQFLTFVARAALISTVASCLQWRLLRRAAVVCPFPGDDLQLLLSRLRAVLGEFGYRPLETAEADRWAFEAKPIDFGGRPLNRASGARTVSIEVAGPALLRVVGSSALLREIRKQFPGTVAVPYTGPQPCRKPFLVLGTVLMLVFASCTVSVLLRL